MKADEYVKAAMRSLKESSDLHFNLNHALHGLCSETGEIADTIKKHIVYVQPLNVANLDEEIGDLMWYVALLCYANNLSLEACMQHNIQKLMKRYPEKFTPQAALARADKNDGGNDVGKAPDGGQLTSSYRE